MSLASSALPTRRKTVVNKRSWFRRTRMPKAPVSPRKQAATRRSSSALTVALLFFLDGDCGTEVPVSDPRAEEAIRNLPLTFRFAVCSPVTALRLAGVGRLRLEQFFPTMRGNNGFGEFL